MSTMVWKDRVAVVTGAGGTLCSVIAKHLAAKGVKVVLVGRTKEKLDPVAEAIKSAGGVCRVEPGDVTDEARMTEIAECVKSEWGCCRILVNGAGGNNIKAMSTLTQFDRRELDHTLSEGERGFSDIDLAAFESVLKINTIGTVLPCRVFGMQMASAGGGSILNFASMNTYRPLTRVAAYAMSKAAIANFTQFLANYYAPANIRVNGDRAITYKEENAVMVDLQYVLEDLAELPVRVELASEYRYRKHLPEKDTLTIVISQSGETADSLAALREAKAHPSAFSVIFLYSLMH